MKKQESFQETSYFAEFLHHFMDGEHLVEELHEEKNYGEKYYEKGIIGIVIYN